MVTRSGISGKKVPYDILHNLSSADILYDNKKMKNRRKTLGVFEAERLIAQRRDKEVIAQQFNIQISEFNIGYVGVL